VNRSQPLTSTVADAIAVTIVNNTNARMMGPEPTARLRMVRGVYRANNRTKVQYLHRSKGSIRFQSFCMSTMVQPFVRPSSSALSSLPMCEVRS
jgi:hypothetical protein